MFDKTKQKLTDKISEPAQNVATLAIAALVIAGLALLISAVRLVNVGGNA